MAGLIGSVAAFNRRQRKKYLDSVTPPALRGGVLVDVERPIVVKKNRQVRRNAKRSLAGSLGQMRLAPAAIGEKFKIGNPQYRQGTSGGFIITHKEYVNQVVGTSTPFLANGYIINPVLGSTFSWLSSLAVNFDKYIIHSLCFHFVSSCATSTAGRVALAVNTDSSDPAPTDRAGFHNIEGVVDANAWDQVDLVVPCDKVVRYLNVSSTSDPKLVDVGQFFTATYGTGASTVLGDIYVSYSVELLKPIGGANFTEQVSGSIISTMVATGPAYASFAGSNTSQAVAVFNTPGTFVVSFIVTGTVLSAPGFVATGSTSIVRSGSIVNAAATTASGNATLLITQPGDGFTYNFSPTTVTSSTWFISKQS